MDISRLLKNVPLATVLGPTCEIGSVRTVTVGDWFVIGLHGSSGLGLSGGTGVSVGGLVGVRVGVDVAVGIGVRVLVGMGVAVGLGSQYALRLVSLSSIALTKLISRLYFVVRLIASLSPNFARSQSPFLMCEPA